MGSCFCAQFVPRAPFGAVNIVHKIALLPRALFYSASCSICWSINLRLPRAKLVTFWDTAPVSATAGDAPIVNKLGYKDRFSVVSSAGSQPRYTPLREMTETSKEAARSELRNLVAGGESGMVPTLQRATEVRYYKLI
jgi:hypothetical protein